MSGETKWTPGPWRLVRQNDDFEPFEIRMGTALKTPGNCRVIHRIAVDWCVEPGDKDYREGMATLRLIAAAPALYEALLALVDGIDSDNHGHLLSVTLDPAREAARAALSLARGETPDNKETAP